MISLETNCCMITRHGCYILSLLAVVGQSLDPGGHGSGSSRDEIVLWFLYGSHPLSHHRISANLIMEDGQSFETRIGLTMQESPFPRFDEGIGKGVSVQFRSRSESLSRENILEIPASFMIPVSSTESVDMLMSVSPEMLSSYRSVRDFMVLPVNRSGGLFYLNPPTTFWQVDDGQSYIAQLLEGYPGYTVLGYCGIVAGHDGNRPTKSALADRFHHSPSPVSIDPFVSQSSLPSNVFGDFIHQLGQLGHLEIMGEKVFFENRGGLDHDMLPILEFELNVGSSSTLFILELNSTQYLRSTEIPHQYLLAVSDTGSNGPAILGGDVLHQYSLHFNPTEGYVSFHQSV